MLWRTRTQALLDAKDVLGVVTDTAVSPSENAPAESVDRIWAKDRKAYDIIMAELHERDRQVVIGNPTLQNSARTLWLHFYLLYGVVDRLQVDKAWTQFHECRTNLEDPNLVVNFRVAIAKLEEAGQATDTPCCRTLVLFMFPSSLQPLKDRLSQDEATLDEILAHLETVIQTCREPVAPLVSSANPAREDADEPHPAQKSSEHSHDREIRARRRINNLPARSKKCKVPTARLSNALNNERILGASLANNQEPGHFPHDEVQPHNPSLPSDVSSESKDVESNQSLKAFQESANEPRIPAQTSSSGMRGPSTARNSPRNSNNNVGSSSNMFDSHEDIKPNIRREPSSQKDAKPEISKEAALEIPKDGTPDIQQNGKSETQKDLKNEVQKEAKADIEKKSEPNSKKEESSNVEHIYEEHVASSCAAQNPSTSSRLRTKLDQKSMTLNPETPEFPQPVESSTSRESQPLHDQTSRTDFQALERGNQAEPDGFDANTTKEKRTQKDNSRLEPHMKPGKMEWMRYRLQNSRPRLVIHYGIKYDELKYLYEKYYNTNECVNKAELIWHRSFYNETEKGVIPGPQNRSNPWRAAVQLLNPSRVLSAKMTIPQFKNAYNEECKR